MAHLVKGDLLGAQAKRVGAYAPKLAPSVEADVDHYQHQMPLRHLNSGRV
jgi:hypothetical protein